jgi:hypothetical protein
MISLESKKLQMMVRDILATQPMEIGCDTCYSQLDQFVEMILMGRDGAMELPLVAAHLELCDACHEEFEALLSALRALS